MNLISRKKFTFLKKKQKIGNCTVANTNSLELALIYLQFEKIIGHESAEEIARAIKSTRVAESRVNLIKEYLEYHETKQNYPLDSELIIKIYEKYNVNTHKDIKITNLIKDWSLNNNIVLNINKENSQSNLNRIKTTSKRKIFFRENLPPKRIGKVEKSN